MYERSLTGDGKVTGAFAFPLFSFFFFGVGKGVQGRGERMGIGALSIKLPIVEESTMFFVVSFYTRSV